MEDGLRFAGVLWFFHKIDENGKVIRVEADRRKPGGCEGQMATDEGEVKGRGSAIWRQPGRGVFIKETEGAAVDGLINFHAPRQGSVVPRYGKPSRMVGIDETLLG